MSLIKNYNYTEKEISMVVSDETGGQFLWVGFKIDDTTCALQKVSANDPLQVYYDIDLSVDEIKAGVINESYLYTAFDDETYIGARYSLSNPLISPAYFSIPVGITEAPVEILISTYIYFLIPGDAVGTNAKIVKMTTLGVFVETIDLPTITHAKSFTRDSVTGDIWICTYTSPATFVRVYNDGSWHYTVNY